MPGPTGVAVVVGLGGVPVLFSNPFALYSHPSNNLPYRSTPKSLDSPSPLTYLRGSDAPANNSG